MIPYSSPESPHLTSAFSWSRRHASRLFNLSRQRVNRRRSPLPFHTRPSLLVDGPDELQLSPPPPSPFLSLCEKKREYTIPKHLIYPSHPSHLHGRVRTTPLPPLLGYSTLLAHYSSLTDEVSHVGRQDHSFVRLCDLSYVLVLVLFSPHPIPSPPLLHRQTHPTKFYLFFACMHAHIKRRDELD